jgi:hypothetical protein
MTPFESLVTVVSSKPETKLPDESSVIWYTLIDIDGRRVTAPVDWSSRLVGLFGPSERSVAI